MGVMLLASAAALAQTVSSSPTLVTTWGSAGSGPGQFNGPQGLAIDPAGNVYVADSDNNRIQKFTSNGNYLNKWGIAASGPGQFNSPSDVAIDSAGNIYVADTSNHRIQKFNSNRIFLSQLGTGSVGSGEGQFNTPRGVAVGAADVVYVSDQNNNRMQKFDSHGTFLATWGTRGSDPGQFINPAMPAVDASGNIYVAEYDNNRVQKFQDGDTTPPDTTPPTTTATPRTQPNEAGWYKDNVTVDLATTDNVGVKQITYSVTDDADPGQPVIPQTTVQHASTSVLIAANTGQLTLHYTATDDANNVEDEKTLQLKIDRVPPGAGCVGLDEVWHDQDVTANCMASDNADGSGLANAADATFSLSTSVPNGTENANAQTNSREVFDVAGNSRMVGSFSAKIDKKAPDTNCGTADGLWHQVDATISCTSSDGGSGLADAADASFQLTTNVPINAETDNAQTNGRTIFDAVGHSAQAGPITGNKVDKKAPSISTVSPAANQTKVPLSFHVFATFDDDMDADSVRASFTLDKVKVSGSTVTVIKSIPATVNYPQDNNHLKTAELVPANGQVEKGVTYRATITTTAKDKAGNTLQTSKVWTFKTVTK